MLFLHWQEVVLNVSSYLWICLPISPFAAAGHARDLGPLPPRRRPAGRPRPRRCRYRRRRCLRLPLLPAAVVGGEQLPAPGGIHVAHRSPPPRLLLLLLLLLRRRQLAPGHCHQRGGESLSCPLKAHAANVARPGRCAGMPGAARPSRARNTYWPDEYFEGVWGRER